MTKHDNTWGVVTLVIGLAGMGYATYLAVKGLTSGVQGGEAIALQNSAAIGTFGGIFAVIGWTLLH